MHEVAGGRIAADNHLGRQATNLNIKRTRCEFYQAVEGEGPKVRLLMGRFPLCRKTYLLIPVLSPLHLYVHMVYSAKHDYRFSSLY